MLSGDVIAAIEARGLDPELVARLGVDGTDKLDGVAIAIPYFMNGQVVNHKYRTLTGEKRFMQDANSVKCFWNIDCLRDENLADQPLIITEGEFDAIAALQSGFFRVLSVPDGAPKEEVGDQDSKKYSYIDDRFYEAIKGVREIILAVDGDGPGANLLNDLALKLGKSRCKWVSYPKGCKDLNDALRKYGVKGVKMTMERAQWLRVAGLFRMSELPPVPDATPLPSGIPGLEEHFNLRMGDFTVITGIPSHGKALYIETPIPTPSGWTTMGELRVGDVVFGDDGIPCRVKRITPVMHDHDCFKMIFSDGSELIADADHQWLTSTDKARRSERETLKKRNGREETLPGGSDQRWKRTYPSVVTTKEISTTLRAQGKWNHQIQNAKPLSLPMMNVPIPPYTLGVWLGDGYSSSGAVTCFDHEIIDCVSADGVVARARKNDENSFCLIGIQPVLRKIGVLGNKHIPASYLRSSEEQRLELLKGLMDTDGYCAKDGTCEITLTNHQLAMDTYEVICSLGLRAKWMEGRATLNGRDISAKYRIQFTPPYAVFKLKRKANRQRYSGQNRAKTSYRTVMGCVSVPSVPVRCIEVDSPSHMFLAGREMIPTHNSSFVNDLVCHYVERYGFNVTFASFEQHPQLDHKRNLRRWHAKVKVHSATREELELADIWIDQHFSFIVPDEDEDATLAWCLERCAASVIQHGSKIIVIDPWNEMDHIKAPDQSLTEYVGYAIKQFKKFARKYHVHVIVVAHPAKLKRKDDGEFPIPDLYDISDCYSDDTEALTKRGWLRHEEMVVTDEVMCFDLETGENRWESPERIVCHDFDGEMMNFVGYGYDLLVSPNHRMVIKPDWKEPVGDGSGRGRPVKYQKGVWGFETASRLPKAPFTLPKAGTPVDGDDPDLLTIDGKVIPALEFAEFMGLWVAEGCWQSSGISMCQKEGPVADRIDHLIEALGFSATRAVHYDKRGLLPIVTWYFGVRDNPELIRWVRGKAGENSATRCIPYPFFSMSSRIKVEFLNGYIAGDGCISKNRGTPSAVTSSPRLYGELQRLAVELGIPVNGHRIAAKKENHNDTYQINFGRGERSEVCVRTYRNLKTVPYSGKIWCLTVPTGAYYVRRNGCVAVCGNSSHWNNKPDAGIVVHRSSPTESLIRIVKSRYHDSIGKPGEKTYSFNDHNGRYQWVDEINEF